ncbi:MAG: phage tail sheath subtilisin-like domain-containing protein [Candidatus Cardinium sp.]|nr:phage tail sheath subtilisin-like domain-containing protein [Candidatus Cardinium sp.]
MAENLKTPGVYIVEKDTGANAVVQVSTAVPAFIGFTERAEINGRSFHMKPVQISSLSEYELFFGGPIVPVYTVKEVSDGEKDLVMNGKSYVLEQSPHSTFYLYNSLKLFFDNGGADCFIVSIGQYGSETNPVDISAEAFKQGIDALAGEEVPTMLLMPDSLLLEEEDASYYSVQTYALAHCGKYLNKVALFDIWGGNHEWSIEDKNKYVNKFREYIGLDNLSYGAAYYPWLRTNIIPLNSIDYRNFDLASLKNVLQGEQQTMLTNLVNATTDKEKLYWDAGLKNTSKEYKLLRKTIADRLNILPSAPAMAGLYTRTDKARGVWIAPANQNLNSVLAPVVKITHEEQEALNVDGISGKSINAIRTFKGAGAAVVWGARTLAGNSPEWRYINVRRLFILIEQSIKNAAFSVVFRPNVPVTWAVVQGMISNFLTNLWRQGALVGTSPGEAFTVLCGLGETMTQDDVNEGIMRISVKVAAPRPAEFIVITFEQKMGADG